MNKTKKLSLVLALFVLSILSLGLLFGFTSKVNAEEKAKTKKELLTEEIAKANKAKDGVEKLDVPADKFDEELKKKESTKKFALKVNFETFEAAIKTASDVEKKEGATDDEYTNATTALTAAITTFNSQVKQGSAAPKTQLKGTQIAAIVILCIAIIVPAIMALVKKITTKQEEKKAAQEINEAIKSDINEEPVKEKDETTEAVAKEEVKEEPTPQEEPKEEVKEETPTETPQEEPAKEEKPAAKKTTSKKGKK